MIYGFLSKRLKISLRQMFSISFLYFIFLFLANLDKNISSIIHVKEYNESHFSCDNNTKIFSYENLNDDFCDCNDGSDENKTNACPNGIYKCKNRFYFPEEISTSKLNDGFCDCCDGSDEYISFNCPKTCLDHSSREYNKIKEELIIFKTTRDNTNSQENIKYTDTTLNSITNIESDINKFYNLTKQYNILGEYLASIEDELNIHNLDETEGEKIIESFVDQNGFSYKALKNAYSSISEKLESVKNILLEDKDYINRLKSLNLIHRHMEKCVSFKYKSRECEFCFNSKVKCSGYKKGSSRNLGLFKFFEKNVLYFFAGDECGYYNRKYYTEIELNCGMTNSVELIKKYGACGYRFSYTTELACNNDFLDNIIDKITLFLGEI